MSDTVLFTIITLSAIGIIAAVILYFLAQKFKVYEDPKIDEVDEALPSANCGGCGFPGCRNFAEACVKTDDLDSLFCPVGGNDCMSEVATILGKVVAEKTPQVAVLRCNGSPKHRERVNTYDGAENCTIAHNLYGGYTDCSYGCLGMGECVDSCNFEAMYMDKETDLPVIIQEMCTACGACIEACPKDLLELRNKGKKDRRIFVSCMNEDKGGVAKKACDVACIGCSKCFKACKFDSIEMKNNRAYIDFEKCVLCRACVKVCPTEAIHEINFPLRKPKPAVEKPASTAEVKDVNLVAEAKKNTENAKVETKVEKEDTNKQDENKNNETK